MSDREPAPAARQPAEASADITRAAAETTVGMTDAPEPRPRRRLAVNTAIFTVFTGLSRVAGLFREVAASAYFGTQGRFSAFTIAFQIPNLARSLVADSALTAAFVPVFTELLEQRRRREAFQLAGTLFVIITAGLGALTALFILLAQFIVPLFIGPTFSGQLVHLTIGLSQVMFPVVLLFALNGLVVGILNAYDHFSIPAIAPLVWNLVIIGCLIGMRHLFTGDGQIYAYAIGVLLGTVVQLLMALPMLRRIDFRLRPSFHWRDPRVRQVFALMIPVTIGLGILNFDIFLNDTLGSLISVQAPRSIDAAFRIYMLPQGMFSVALGTVLFPALSRAAARHDMNLLRQTMANGIRQIFLLLVPAAAITVALSTPIVRLLYQHGSFGSDSTNRVSLALFWYSFSMPFAGANALLARSFFSLQRPWLPTAIAAGSLVLNAAVSIGLYKPLGIAGPVLGTVIASASMSLGQALILRRRLHGIEGRTTLVAILKILIGAVVLAGVTVLVWKGLDALLGRSLLAQVLTVGVALGTGIAAYTLIVLALRLEEAHQIRRLLAGAYRSRIKSRFA